MTKSRRGSNDRREVHEAPLVPFYVSQLSNNSHRFYVSDEIAEPSQYHQMCQVLRTAHQGDTVYLYLNSPGGRLDSTAQIIAAIKDSKAEVITVADGTVASAATLIFLAGDGYIIQPHCLFMIHNFSVGTYGKGHEVMAHIEADNKWFSHMAEEFYHGFLTPAETERMRRGEDFYFTANEVTARIQSRVSAMQEEVLQKKRKNLEDRFDALSEELDPWLTRADAKTLRKLLSKVAKQIDNLETVDRLLQVDLCEDVQETVLSLESQGAAQD